jgi:hypothetical protein
MAERTEDEQLHDDAEDAIADQTPVYPVTKVTRRKRPVIKLIPTDNGYRAELTPSQVGTLCASHELIGELSAHAKDGTETLAIDAMLPLTLLLERYPVDWQDPKPK